MKYIKNTGFENRKSRRAARAKARKIEVKSISAKRMDRPQKLDIVAAGSLKLQNFFGYQ